MDFYYSSSVPVDESFYYTEVPYDRGYHESYYCYSPVASYSSYEFFPAQPLVAYSAWPESYTNSVSIQYHSAAETDDDLNFVEYDPHPYGGGYDIVQTYGKPLAPGEEICYPRSSSASASPGKLPHPEKVEDPNKTEAQVTEEEQEEEVDTEVEEGVEEEEEEEGEELSSVGKPHDGFEETTAGSVQVYGGVEEYNPPAVDQVPPGYGLEAFDLCENLFGYWPCLSRMNKKCSSCGKDICVTSDGDAADQWKRTADYLFGSPDPYRGWPDQSGYYAYQM